MPMVAWMVLELKLNAARIAVMIGSAAVGLARLIGVSVLIRGGETMTWERLHSLNHAWVAIPSVLAALVGSGDQWR